MIAAKGQAIRGVGQRYFSERLPNLRIATDDGRPICDGCLASFRRSSLESCDVCGVLWGVPGESDEEFAICPQCQEEIHAFERARRYGP